MTLSLKTKVILNDVFGWLHFYPVSHFSFSVLITILLFAHSIDNFSSNVNKIFSINTC